MNDKHVIKIAKEEGKTPAQILIKWSLQNNVLTIPKSTKKNHVLENFKVMTLVFKTIPEKKSKL